MGERKNYPPFTFCWIELQTTDAAAAKTFYTQLFGWTADDSPVGPDAVYTMLRMDGKNVCALYEMDETMRAEGIPSHWQSYVSVEDVDATAARAKTLGGSVSPEPFDVMQYGRMAGIVDPAGARFALWQPRAHFGAERVNDPGAWSWNELRTRDLQAAKKFYTELFGWTMKPSPGASGEYIEFQNKGRSAGGMLEIQPEWGEMPSEWSVYFTVADLDESLASAAKAGASTPSPPIDLQGVGRFAPLQDPTGAGLNLIQLEEGAAED